MKKLLVVLGVISLFLCTAVLADGSGSTDHWICLECGCEGTGSLCEICGKPAGAWICSSCSTENLADSCRSCGLTMTESLTRQAASGNLLTAYPAVCFLAGQGQPDALVSLGHYYELGLFVPKNTAMALSCLQLAANADYAPAWVELGRVYDKGDLVTRDYYKSMECYQKAADLGSVEALWYLGTFYEDGSTVRQNYEKALDYYRKAADKGDADSLMSIAYCYSCRRIILYDI